jgi:hypothetical protein
LPFSEFDGSGSDDTRVLGVEGGESLEGDRGAVELDREVAGTIIRGASARLDRDGREEGRPGSLSDGVLGALLRH